MVTGTHLTWTLYHTSPNYTSLHLLTLHFLSFTLHYSPVWLNLSTFPIVLFHPPGLYYNHFTQQQNDNCILLIYLAATFRVTEFFSQYTGNCCSISHTLTCLSHNLKRHYYHVQRSFLHLPISGQINPVHISHIIYIIPTFKKFSDVGTTY